jgi:RNA polymerase sigma-B factor
MSREIRIQTQELFARLRTQLKAADYRRTRDTLILINLGLVEKIAGRYAQDGVEVFEDLVQVGVIGLIKAVDRYNPAKGTAFSSYAVPYIRGEILHHRRDRAVTLKIPRSWSDRFTLLRQLYDERASHAAMASATRIPIDQIPQALNALLRPDCLSLDAPLAAGLTDCWELPDSRPPPEPDWEPEPVYEVSCWGLAQ